MSKSKPTLPGGDAISQAVQHEVAKATAYAHAQTAYTMALDTLEPSVIATLETLQSIMGGWFTEMQGFDKADFATDIALMHSELSEALEADRKDLMDDHIPDFHGRAAELADVLVRVLHVADKYQIPLGPAFFAKMKFNLQRPHRHGKGY